MLRENLESVKRVLNVNNATVHEYEDLLDFYKQRALDGCSSDLEDVVQRIFNFGYKSKKIDIKSAQRNFALCSLASITSKLTRGSADYDYETNKEIEYLIVYYCNYYYTLLMNNKFEYSKMREPVLAIASLDKYVTSGVFNNYDSVRNLTKLSDLLFNNKINSLEFIGSYGNEAKENINHIANRPAEGPTAIDIFGIPVDRNDLVLKVLIEEAEAEENRFRERMIKHSTKM